MKMHDPWVFILRSVGWLVIAGLVLHVVDGAPGCLAGKGDKQVVHLYFADAKRPFLVAEARVVIDSGDPMAFSRKLVSELIDGSARGNLATIPAGTQLRSLFLLDDGTAVVDFTARIRKNHPGSCRLAQLTLFSVVNSLILNVSEIDRVKILIDGAEVQTLTGHLALEFPLTADMLLTR